VLDHAMQMDRHRPVLVLTRCIDMHCYLEAMQMGAIDYLEKPVPPTDLVRLCAPMWGTAEIKLRGDLGLNYRDYP